MRTKKELVVIIITAVVLVGIAIFSLINWSIIKFLFTQLFEEVDILKEYVLDLGIIGFISMSIIRIFCFFFPFISSIPIQLTSALSYGLWFGLIHVVLSVFIANQILFLITKDVRFFSSKKKRQEHLLLEEKIKNSNRSIYFVLFLAYLVPFLPFLIIHTVAADSGMKWWKYTLVTLLGPIPDIFCTLWVGVKITNSSSPAFSFGLLLLILTIIVLSMIFKNKLVDFIFTPKKEKTNGTAKQE
jgi:uncharacterized membrane protein YdjX (TVP38/TMEM64 family)